MKRAAAWAIACTAVAAVVAAIAAPADIGADRDRGPSLDDGELARLVEQVDQLRGTTDPGEETLLLDRINEMQAELRRRQGEVDPWVRYWHGLRRRMLTPFFLVGLVGQLVFASRFLIQWVVSVRRGESTIPVAFWLLSVIGSTMVLSYGIITKEPVIIIGQIGLVVYIHNLILIRRSRQGTPRTES